MWIWHSTQRVIWFIEFYLGAHFSMKSKPTFNSSSVFAFEGPLALNMKYLACQWPSSSNMCWNADVPVRTLPL